MTKTIPLSSLATRTKGLAVKNPTPYMPTGRVLDELRIKPATNGYTADASTSPVKMPKTGAMEPWKPPQPTILKTHQEVLDHVAGVLKAHEATMAKPIKP